MPDRQRKPAVLSHDFYERPTLEVACDLIGMVLVHDSGAGRAAGMIVEAEAYIGETDPACHAARGLTRRTEPLYGPPGRAYVYFNYGMHYLVNAVTERSGVPAAVLLRALEPLEGVELMRLRRARPLAPAVALCRGPGNLTRALGIDLALNRADLSASALTIEDWGFRPGPLTWTPRVGISVGTEPYWRVLVPGHSAVSGPPARRRAANPEAQG
ncbi:MAG: DNA-3-methyladenine glycosylase [Vicinamibacterales bacterium]